MALYEALPFHPSPERAEIVSELLRRVAATDSIFSEERECERECFERPLEEMCETCASRMRKISAVLTAPTTVAFEVWSADALAGVIFFTSVSRGLDALGHYVFFDNKLSDKTSVIENVLTEMFDALDLARVSIEIPAPFVALARHAHKKLGFGGDFTRYLKGGFALPVEGVKKNAARWKGDEVDLLVLGRLKQTSPQEPDESR